MARHEQDREDLMREATRLMPRCRWSSPEEPEDVVLGMRSPAALSVYFGADPALHFNSAGELRRGYVDGRLWVARKRQLIVMRRDRETDEVVLRSHPMADEEQEDSFRRLRHRLQRLQLAILSGAASCVEAVPDQVVDVNMWAEALAQVAQLRVAERPHAT